MTKYNVHLYREMKLCFQDIEADSPEQAAQTCRDFPEDEACGAAVDCDGETFAALVDTQGDPDYSQTVLIAFGPERARSAVHQLMEALDYVRATLRLRHLDEASDGEVEEALTMAEAALSDANPDDSPPPSAPSPVTGSSSGLPRREQPDVVPGQGHPLIVPAGQGLETGKLYLRLFHGRNDPREELDDWGFAGPVFGPLDFVTQTYLAEFRLEGPASINDPVILRTSDDLVSWDGKYYGDLSVFIAGEKDAA
ncbi:MAG: hypothetical protein AB7I30_05645 [Isosphaeraceae bacterium]